MTITGNITTIVLDAVIGRHGLIVSVLPARRPDLADDRRRRRRIHRTFFARAIGIFTPTRGIDRLELLVQRQFELDVGDDGGGTDTRRCSGQRARRPVTACPVTAYRPMPNPT